MGMSFHVEHEKFGERCSTPITKVYSFVFFLMNHACMTKIGEAIANREPNRHVIAKSDFDRIWRARIAKF